MGIGEWFGFGTRKEPEPELEAAPSSADLLVAASDGVAPAPGLIVRAQAAGAVPVASRLAVYEEALGDGEAGLLFEPNDLETLTAQLGRLVVDGDLRERLRAAARPRPWAMRPTNAPRR